MNEAEKTAIKGVIDKIWDQYDVDKSGLLEKDEIKMFLIYSLKELRSGSDFSQEAFDEVFIDGFYHADPHPGNLLLLKDGRYGILDFGVCGRLTPQMRETLIVLALAVAIRDSDTAARTLYRLGHAESRVSISDLRDDVDVREMYGHHHSSSRHKQDSAAARNPESDRL